MTEEDRETEKKARITYLAGGAILGAALGLLIGNIFLMSSLGILLGVIFASKLESKTSPNQ